MSIMSHQFRKGLGLLRVKMKQGNSSYFKKIHQYEKEISPLYLQYKDIRDKCESEAMTELEKLYPSDIVKLSWDDVEWEKFQQLESELHQKYNFKHVHDQYEKLQKKIHYLQNRIEHKRYKHQFQIDDIIITAIGYQYYNLDASRFMTDYLLEIDIHGRKYWHKNIFDGGDIMGKEGFKAHWYYNMNPEEAKKDGYEIDDIDQQNFATISQLCDRGLIM